MTTDTGLHCACGDYTHNVGDDWKAWEAHLDKCPAEGLRRANMKHIYDYVRGEKGRALLPSVQRQIDREVWSLQDGYGVAGFTPVQGWDWSGIRDSTPETVKAMAAAVTRIVAAAKRGHR